MTASVVNFDCPACGQNLEAPLAMAGHAIECPACEKKIVLPQPGGKAELLVESPAPEANEATPAAVEPEAAEEPVPAERAAGPAPAQGKKKIVMRSAGRRPAWVHSRGDGQVARGRTTARPHVPGAAGDSHAAGASPKGRTTALVLLLFLGWLGAHRMYVGKVGTGLLFMITFGGFWIWWMVDLVMITSGSFRDKQGRLVGQW